ncbi:HET-domain-containing protein [Mycena sanguinolenta]|uniref:HET-domain-containing protein n=1 Tax=Mycena sanguinolenta TaxID=230812 RepID=A0A8H7DKZ7_9AGAR|nr:HET-domain-containing protein [Mycena sanguinolenta]
MIQGDRLEKVLEEWLAPPKVSDRQSELQEQQHKSTGSWLLNDSRFQKWQTTPGSLWIKGFSGTGKSVLSSMVIEEILEAYSSRCAVAYFYFDFRNKMQHMKTMLCSLTWQLSSKASPPHSALSQLYERLGHGTIQPPSEHLQEVLKNILSELAQSYIVIDALDECNQADCGSLVQFICSLDLKTVHLLFTSQPLEKFHTKFKDITSIELDSVVTSSDIRSFVGSAVLKVENWACQDNHAKAVTEQIMKKSNGMFRLAACLLIELSHCYWEDEWEETLEALPADLFGIYNRFWTRAIDTLKKPVFIQAIFQWLVFSAREMTPTELADAVAFHLDKPGFDFSNLAKSMYYPERNQGNIDAFKILEGLIVIKDKHLDQPTHRWDFSLSEYMFGDKRPAEPSIALAHSSVKDYILSPHFHQKFSIIIGPDVSHKFIAQTCVRYLQIFADPKYSMSKATLPNYPMALYAGNYWFHHLKLCNEQDQEALLASTIHLLQNESRQYKVVYQLHPSNSFFGTLQWDKPRLSALSMCSKIGYTRGVCFLLSNSDIFVDEVNGNGETALHIACEKGHFGIAELLIKYDASVDLCANNGKTALHLALEDNHLNIVQLLLHHNATVDLAIKDGKTALHLASQKGYLEIVQLLIKHNASVNLATKDSKTALHLASQKGYLEIVQLLIKHNASVDLATKNGETGLHFASWNGRLNTAQLLIKHNASVDSHTNDGETVLHLASRKGYHEIVQLLIKHNASVDLATNDGATALHLASRKGYLEIVQLLIKHNASVDLATKDGKTALHLASQKGHLHIVQLLIKHNASVDLVTNDGKTALHLASKNDELSVVQLLIEHNASVDLATNDGETALHLASHKGYLHIAQLLIKHNASIDLATKDGRTALHLASKNDELSIVQLLLDHNASVDLATNDGKTALHLASQKGYLEIVQLLIKHNASVDLAPKDGETALHLASQNGYFRIVQLLIKHNASVDLATKDGKTALHFASWNGRLKTAQLLIEQNASVESHTNDGETALQLASSKGYLHIVQLLIKHNASVDL